MSDNPLERVLVDYEYKIKSLQSQLAETQKRLDEAEKSHKTEVSMHNQEWLEHEAAKRELAIAVECLKYIDQMVHPFTIHEHRDELENRFALTIERARATLATINTQDSHEPE